VKVYVGAAPAAPPPPAPSPDLDGPLRDALVRFLATSTCPLYLRAAAEPWVAAKEVPA
jgi:hypothetical protein